MNPLLSEIYSIINGYSNAKDTERVFTFIEFVKQFGYDNDTDVFISAYKDYVTQWSIVKKESLEVSTEDFVTTRLIDVLKSITLDYSSYEEQDFISHIDFSNKEQLLGLCALYSRKIKQIAEYYKQKRNETSQIVKKNVQKGTIKSIQEIIYEKIFDYLFSNRNIIPSYKNIKRDLIVSVENYIDTYSDYFDIPREVKVDDDSRSKMLNQLLAEMEAQNAVMESNQISSNIIDELELDTDEHNARRMFARRRSIDNGIEEVEEAQSTTIKKISSKTNRSKTTGSIADNANKNDVDYKVFLEDSQMMVSDLLFSGDVHLRELPLVAQLSVDLSQECVGDMLALKEQLLKDTTVNQVELEEQVQLKKDIYEKFIGVDLWYAYVDPNGNVKVDELCKAKNPTGNLLNVGSADSATIEKSNTGALNQTFGSDGSDMKKYPVESYLSAGSGYSKTTGWLQRDDSGAAVDDGSQYLELLSRIGLFFKPDKTSILTVNSKDFTWSIDTDALIPDTVYIFPDPNKYGDIGNNKSVLYPLIMEHKLDYDIKNLTSGFSKNDPIVYLTSQGWFSYYSKQQDDFKIYNNINYDYSFTSLVNKGYMTNYQQDIWGNEFCILKGYDVQNIDGKFVITANPKYNETHMKNVTNDISVSTDSKYISLNGGYFKDPFGFASSSIDGAFDYKRKMIVIDKEDDKYILSGMSFDNKGFYHPTDTPIINFGKFSDLNGKRNGIIFNDHYGKNIEKYEDAMDSGIIVNKDAAQTENVYTHAVVQEQTTPSEELGGQLWVKFMGKAPMKFEEAFDKKIFNEENDWLEDGEQVINFHLVAKNLVIETNKNYRFVYYNYNGIGVTDERDTPEVYTISKEKIIYDGGEQPVIYSELIFNESDECFYVLLIESLSFDSKWDNDDLTKAKTEKRSFLIPRIYKFDCSNYKMIDILYPYDAVCYDAMLSVYGWKNFGEKMKAKDTISHNESNLPLYKDILIGEHHDMTYECLSNFEIPYSKDVKLNDVSFSYNNNIQQYLIAYSLSDPNGTPYIYQHKFKLGDIDTFNETLQSRLYTLTTSGDSYKWNDSFDFDKISVNVIPNNGDSIVENTIWDSYNGEGHANEGIDMGVNKNQKISSVETEWKSEVYDWTDLGYTLLTDENIRITGEVEWIGANNSYDIITGKNTFGIKIANIRFDGLNNEVITFDNYEGDTFDIYRDVLGNISGVKTIRITKENLDTIDGYDRKLMMDLTISVKGDSNTPVKCLVYVIAKDIKTTAKQEEIDGEYVNEDKRVKFSFDSEVFDYDSLTNNKTLNENKKIICTQDWLCDFIRKDFIDGIVIDKNKEFSKGMNYCRITIPACGLKVDGESSTEQIIAGDTSIDINGEAISYIFALDIGDSLNTRINAVEVVENNGELIEQNKQYTLTLSGDTINKDGSFKVKEAFFEKGWLNVIFEATISICGCEYTCYIGYNKYGSPVKFNLNGLADATDLFSNSSEITNPWSFTDNDNHVHLNSKNLTNMCKNSNCSIFKLENIAARNVDNMMSQCPNLNTFSVQGFDNTEPFTKTISAKHMFFDTYPIGNIEFNYNMPCLRNAEGMFYKKVTVNNDKIQNINENKTQLNDAKREKDFNSLYITTPNLISAPMMFWNRPLTFNELEHFEKSLPDISITRKVFDNWLSKDFDVICVEYADTLFADIEKTEDWTSSISWERKIQSLAALTDDINTNLSVLDEEIYKSYIFPSISIWYQTNDKSNLENAKNIIKNIANKGWEVSTNLNISGGLNGGNDYLIRAYEYGNAMTEAFVGDQTFMYSAINNVNYLLDVCKTVLNPIECNTYDAWVKICLLWSRVGVESNDKQRSMFTVSQILGDVPVNGYGQKSKASLFDGIPNEKYCQTTWFTGSLGDFRRTYGLYFKKR